jgi:hypothetical protein
VPPNKSLRPHPATVIQAKAPHPATVVQAKAPHMATTARPRRAPHPGTVQRLAKPAGAERGARVAQSMQSSGLSTSDTGPSNQDQVPERTLLAFPETGKTLVIFEPSWDPVVETELTSEKQDEKAITISCGGLTIEGATVIIHGLPEQTAKWQVGYMQDLHCTEIDTVHYLDDETKIIHRVYTSIPFRDVPVNNGETIWTVAPTQGTGTALDLAVLKSLGKFEDFPANTSLEEDLMGILGHEQFTAYMVAINETDQKMLVLKQVDWTVTWHVLRNRTNGSLSLGSTCKVSLGHTVGVPAIRFPILEGKPANSQKKDKSGLKKKDEKNIRWL